MSSTTRDDDGKFIVKMPFKMNKQKLGTNVKIAQRQNASTDVRRKKNVTYNELYTNYMSEMKSHGFMTEVELPLPGQESTTYQTMMY